MSTESGASTTRRPSVILRSKITPQLEQQGMELRPRLVAVLNEMSSMALLLIQAPAGYGKSTLLKQWMSKLLTRRWGEDISIGCEVTAGRDGLGAYRLCLLLRVTDAMGV